MNTVKALTPQIDRFHQSVDNWGLSDSNVQVIFETYEVAKQFHASQTYGSFPYMEHVCAVFNTVDDTYVDVGMELARFLGEEPTYNPSLFVRVGQTALFHDVLEDCDITYNDIKSLKDSNGLNLILDAQPIYDITNDLGKDRVERNLRTYLRMRDNPIACYVKLCDRLSNMKASKASGSSMFNKYKTELDVMHYALSKNSEGRKNDFLDPLWEQLFTLRVTPNELTTV